MCLLPFTTLVSFFINTPPTHFYLYPIIFLFFFFFNDPAPPEISPLPLHAPLPISAGKLRPAAGFQPGDPRHPLLRAVVDIPGWRHAGSARRCRGPVRRRGFATRIAARARGTGGGYGEDTARPPPRPYLVCRPLP